MWFCRTDALLVPDYYPNCCIGCVSNDKSADLRARRWCPHAIGLGNLGVGVEYILEAAPHKVGDVSPVRVCVT